MKQSQQELFRLSLAHDMSGRISTWNVRFLKATWEEDAWRGTRVHTYPRAAVERMMKVQEVILRAMAKKITWWQAAEILGLSDRQMRRWHWRYREYGYDGLIDRRVGQPSPKRVPLAVVEQLLALYQEKYFDLNVRHFHEKLREQHQMGLSYTW